MIFACYSSNNQNNKPKTINQVGSLAAAAAAAAVAVSGDFIRINCWRCSLGVTANKKVVLFLFLLLLLPLRAEKNIYERQERKKEKKIKQAEKTKERKTFAAILRADAAAGG